MKNLTTTSQGAATMQTITETTYAAVAREKANYFFRLYEEGKATLPKMVTQAYFGKGVFWGNIAIREEGMAA